MDYEDRKSKVFFLTTFFISLYLLLTYQDHTRSISHVRGWYTEPFLAPMVGLAILCLFSLIKLILVLPRKKDEPSFIAGLIENLSYYRVVVITAVLFLAYIHLISQIGFALSTILFVLSILWLSRLLSPLWALNTLLAVAFILLIFRAGVNIWIPDVALYEALFDGDLLWFMNNYF